MNIPYDNQNYSLPDTNSNSYQICRIYNDIKKYFDFGIFNINEINYPNPINNIIIDKHFEKFGGVLDYILENKFNNTKDLINYCQTLINSEPILFKNSSFYLSINGFEEKLTLSQFKTRIGIVICHYVPKYFDA